MEHFEINVMALRTTTTVLAYYAEKYEFHNLVYDLNYIMRIIIKAVKYTFFWWPSVLYSIEPYVNIKKVFLRTIRKSENDTWSLLY